MTDVLDRGPFFHGTIANLRAGDLLTAGFRSNYRPDILMNHIYFTSLVNGAGLAGEIAAELSGRASAPRVYVVEPTGPFENDPNVTDKKFPGNPTRSYRSTAPLRVVEDDQSVDTIDARRPPDVERTSFHPAIKGRRRNHQLTTSGRDSPAQMAELGDPFGLCPVAWCS